MGYMESRTKEINGKEYQCAPFMAVEGLRLKAYLVRLIGPALAELAGGANGLDAEVSGEMLSKTLMRLTEALDENVFVGLIKRLLQNVICTWTDKAGKKHSIAFASNFEAAMNAVFQGELFSIYPLLAFVLEVNYPDFFAKVAPGIGGKIRQMPMFGAAESE